MFLFQRQLTEWEYYTIINVVASKHKLLFVFNDKEDTYCIVKGNYSTKEFKINFNNYRRDIETIFNKNYV